MHYTLSKETERLLQQTEEKVRKINTFDQGQALEDHERESRIQRVYATLNLNSSGPGLQQTRSIIQGELARERSYNLLRTIAFDKLYARISSINPLDMDELIEIQIQLDQQTKESESCSFMDPVEFPPEEEPLETTGPFRSSSNLCIRDQIYDSPFSPEEAEEKTRGLFTYLRESKDHWLTQGIIAHLTISAYQPFPSFNDELGRLWQSALMARDYPMLAYLPWEKVLLDNRRTYYTVLEEFEQNQKLTDFIEFMVRAVNTSLRECPVSVEALRMARGRLDHFLQRNHETFTRKNYLKTFPDISPTTASRDLSMGVELGFLLRHGSKNNSVYSPTESESDAKTSPHR